MSSWLFQKDSVLTVLEVHYVIGKSRHNFSNCKCNTTFWQLRVDHTWNYSFSPFNDLERINDYVIHLSRFNKVKGLKQFQIYPSIFRNCSVFKLIFGYILPRTNYTSSNFVYNFIKDYGKGFKLTLKTSKR